MVDQYQKMSFALSKLMEFVAGFFLVFMMTWTTCDVVLRAVVRPIPGSYEVVGLAGGIVAGFALPITAWVRGMTWVDVLYQKAGPATRNVLNVVTRLACLVFFVLVSWGLFKASGDMVRSGEVTITLHIPLYGVAYGISVACFVQCLVFVSDLIKICQGKYDTDIQS